MTTIAGLNSKAIVTESGGETVFGGATTIVALLASDLISCASCTTISDVVSTFLP